MSALPKSYCLREKSRLKKDPTEVVSVWNELFGLHFCGVGRKQLHVNNGGPQQVNNICLCDTRCVEMTTRIMQLNTLFCMSVLHLRMS